MTQRAVVMADAIRAAYELTTRMSDVVRPVLDRHDLTFNTAYALWAIEPDEPAPSMKVLAERIHCNAPNLTFLCDQLEPRGYVRRVPSPDDGRRRVVELTDSGRAARAEVGESLLGSTPLGRLDTSALVQFRDLLSCALGDGTTLRASASP